MHLNNSMLIKRMRLLGFPVFTKRLCVPLNHQTFGCIFNPVRKKNHLTSKSDLINSLSIELRTKIVGDAAKNKFHMKVTNFKTEIDFFETE